MEMVTVECVLQFILCLLRNCRSFKDSNEPSFVRAKKIHR